MDARRDILGLVERVRARLWRRQCLRLLRLALYGSAALAALGTGFALWIGNQAGLPAHLGLATDLLGPRLPILLGALPLMPAVVLALRRRPNGQEAARTADHWAGADQLLITAWEIAQRREETPTRAAPVVLRQAERALAGWERRVRAHRDGQTPAALLPPLLLWGATLPWLLLSTPPGHSSLASGAPSAPIVPFPGARLAAAIADLGPPIDQASRPASPVAEMPKESSAPGSVQREGPPGQGRGTPPLALNDRGPKPRVLGREPPPGAASQVTEPEAQDAGSARPAAPSSAGTGGAGAEGAGVLAATRRADDPLTDPETLPPGALAIQPMTRTGTPTADPRGTRNPLDPADPDSSAGSAPASGEAPAMPAVPPASGHNRDLGAPQRALLARYWDSLKARQEP